MSTTPTPPRAKKSGGKTYHITEWRDDRGRKRSKSFGPTKKISQAAAFARYRSWLAEFFARPELRNPPQTISVRELCESYLRHADQYYRRPDGTPTGEAQNLWDALNPLSMLYADLPAAQLRPAQAEAYQQRLILDGLARTTINKRMAGVRRCLRWAVAKEIVPPSTLAGVEAVPALKAARTAAREADPVRAVSWGLVERTLEHMPPTLAVMVRVQWWTGMRPGELCRMRPADMDTTREPWVYRPPDHKTAHRGEIRRVYLGPEARRAIQPLLSRDLHAPIFAPKEAQRQREEARAQAYTPPVNAAGDYRKWRSHHRKRRRPRSRYRPRYDTGSYRQAIHHACDRAGVPRWSPNQLRHAAKNRMERERGIEASRLLLGHSRIETTQLYGERDARKAAALAEKLG